MSEEQTKQNVSLEETFEQIETIIKQLESPEVTLDDSFRLYQAGVEKLRHVIYFWTLLRRKCR